MPDEDAMLTGRTRGIPRIGGEMCGTQFFVHLAVLYRPSDHHIPVNGRERDQEFGLPGGCLPKI